MPAENGQVFIGTWNIRLNFLASEFFVRQRECCFYTAGCVNKMVVSVTGPRAVSDLGGPVIPGRSSLDLQSNPDYHLADFDFHSCHQCLSLVTVTLTDSSV